MKLFIPVVAMLALNLTPHRAVAQSLPEDPPSDRSANPYLFAPACSCKGCSIKRWAETPFDGDPGEFRLGLPQPLVTPDPTDVLNNNLSIDVTPGSAVISGRNVMTIRAVTDVSSFVFVVHRNMTVSSCVITDAQGSYGVTPVKAAGNSSYLRTITFIRSIPAGEVFTIAIDYSGSGLNQGFGSFFSSVNLVMTNSEPYYAGNWWPCKDGDVGKPGDNSDKATLDIAITAPPDYKSTANGVLVGIDDLPNGKRRYRYSTTYPMSSYLVAFAAAKYVSWTDTYVYSGGSMPIEFNVLPGQDGDFVRSELAKVKVMLATLAPLFGEYPFINEKYGIYQFNGGGMEHQTNTGQGFMTSESLTVHELGHQWWGDNVTCRFWNDIWLNEGFATYTEALWEEHKPGSSGLEALKLAMAIRRPSGMGLVYKFSTISFDTVFESSTTYNKGGWVLHMLRHVVGDGTFFNILKAYRAAFERGTATTADFIAIASAVAGRNLETAIEQWVFSRGPPVYRYGYTQSTIDGRSYLRLRIEQTQSPNYPTFDMPIDVRVVQPGAQIDVDVRNSERSVWYLLPLPIAEPLSLVQLDPDQWILANYQTALYTPGPPKIVRISPEPESFVQSVNSPTTVEVAFSDPVQIAPEHMALSRAGAVSPIPVPFTLEYDDALALARLHFPKPLGPGSYSLLVSDAVATANPAYFLDGENTGPLPSGDGVPGGIANFRFTVIGTPCPGDFDSDGNFTLSDVFGYLGAWFARNPLADLNESGTVSIEDLFVFVAAWVSRCES